MATMTIRFVTPFRIGTGRPGRGVDEVVDREEPLRGDSIKGVLRAEARWLLPGSGKGDHPFVQAVFGSQRAPSPWNFELTPKTTAIYTERANVALDDRRRALDGTLHVKEEVALAEATLTLTPHRRITNAGIPPTVMTAPRVCHEALLRVCVVAAEKLGQRRTRGMGWIGVERDPTWAIADDLRLVWAIRDAKEASA